MTKDKLLGIMAGMGACDAAMDYVSEHPSMDAGEIWRTCDRPDWLCWFLLGLGDAHGDSVAAAEYLGGVVADHLEALGWPNPTCPWPERPADVLADLHGRWEHVERLWREAADKGREDGAEGVQECRRASCLRVSCPRRAAIYLQISAECAHMHRARDVPETFRRQYYESYYAGALEAFKAKHD